MKSLSTLDAHFREWQGLSKRLRAQMLPALEVQEALRKSIQPVIEAQNSLQKALEPILAQQEHWKNFAESIQIPRFELPDLSRFTKQAADFQRSVQKLVTPAFEQLQETFHELPPRTQEALLLLGAHGWYLDLDMPLSGLWKLKDAFAEGSVTEAENTLVEYFESRLSEIEKFITERLPHRGHLIRAAFNAHRRQEYELSIPVLLAQTDGICKEVVNQYLFMKQDKKPRTAIYVEQIAADSYRAALLSPLGNDRVKVTHCDHGIMTRPPTPLFSFKCLSPRYLEALKEKTAGSLLRYQTGPKRVTFALAKSSALPDASN